MEDRSPGVWLPAQRLQNQPMSTTRNESCQVPPLSNPDLGVFNMSDQQIAGSNVAK
ncbi:hypothetical protein F441_10102 [Phytophthora nicotianae CJ01A1]|nr:hypothetical protein PPTG_01629 [Phytophthora nicotianae INRA-310]ETK85153.1 hypothetical protein L915_09942 [Phytophthora nicotianae]ETO73840.1 hypothetical protein F444_10258 [Phytophthora nicotianae P1976]ETP14993.1 hypothetical protein F441_10102 [Phytophthora nicotianae CJ01A1]ETP43078.1 hypothetical protein F442_10066 [Phytophthora nicotianae P10297]ETL38572.1 hypothetical protein L916_09855 [Phytophthora nicotianae]